MIDFGHDVAHSPVGLVVLGVYEVALLIDIPKGGLFWFSYAHKKSLRKEL